MSAQALKGWPGLQYEPVPEVVIKLKYREIRKARLNMTSLFLQRGFFDLAARLQNLKRNSRLNAAEKRSRFELILQDYSHAVTQGKAPTAAT